MPRVRLLSRLVPAVLALLCLLPTMPIRAAGLLVADGPFGGVLEQVEHDVTVTINNGIAVTQVDQVFLNTEDRTVEALYTFPVPEGASVANFSMWINGQEMIGEVLEKQRAREVYESYRRQPRPKDPGLLEQVDYKTFELRIFPIFANAEQRIRITYYQKLDTDHDWADYIYPLSTTTRRDVDSTVTGRFSLTMRVLSEIPITGMESPSHADDFVFTRRNDRFHEASLELTGGRGAVDRDVVLAYQTQRARTGLDLITSRPDGEDGYFMLTLTPGQELAKLDTGMDYVFVLDVSGSMRHDQKLRLSAASLGKFIEALGPDDRFEVMAFNTVPTTLFGDLTASSDDALARAREFLNGRDARGGTELRPAIEAAMRYGQPDRPLNVVVLSDGLTEQRDQATLLAAARQRPAHARLFTIGVGNDVNRPMLEQLAQRSGGLADFLSRGDDFERRAEAFRRKLTRPAATDLAIRIAGVDTYDVEPAVLPSLYHGAPLRVFGRYRGSGEATVTVDATIAGRAVVRDTTLIFPDRNNDRATQNPEIERMWALQRVDTLLKDADASGVRDRPVIEEIVRLGEAYSIVTEYTSFIVLENDGEYQRWNIDRRNALRVARDRERRAELNAELEAMREASMAELGPTRLASNSSGKPDQARIEREPIVRVETDAPGRPPSNGGDLDWFGGGGGGGAIDPLSAVVGLTLLGGGVIVRRVRKREAS
ncbi:MAG: VIT domain-containing protein [Planctomycetota bacterium]